MAKQNTDQPVLLKQNYCPILYAISAFDSPVPLISMSYFIAFIFEIMGIKDRMSLSASLPDTIGVISSEHSSVEVQCSVCLSRLNNGEEIRRLPCCHWFHKACVNRWLQLCRRTCPLCRCSVHNDADRINGEEFAEEMVIWFSSFHVAGF